MKIYLSILLILFTFIVGAGQIPGIAKSATVILRKSPSIKGAIVAKVPRYTRIQYDQSINKNYNSEWAFVSILNKNISGWVLNEDIKLYVPPFVIRSADPFNKLEGKTAPRPSDESQKGWVYFTETEADLKGFYLYFSSTDLSVNPSAHYSTALSIKFVPMDAKSFVPELNDFSYMIQKLNLSCIRKTYNISGTAFYSANNSLLTTQPGADTESNISPHTTMERLLDFFCKE